jgi:hypothetical protein
MKLILEKFKNNLANPNLAFLSIIALLFFALALNVPLWGNMLLGLGSLVQADYISDFPQNLSETEYLRGYVYKFILFGILKTTDLFIKWYDYSDFQFVAKLLYYLFCFILTFLFFKWTLIEKSLRDRLKYWLIFWILMFTGNYRQFMEAEELAIIFSLGHFLSIYSNSKRANYFSGIFVFLLFGCKTITILYGGFGLLYLLFFEWENKQKRNSIILSHFAFLLITILLYWFPLHKEIINIQTAMTYQSSLAIKGLATFLKFFKQFIEFISFIPLIFIIPVLIVLSLNEGWKKVSIFLVFLLLSSSIVILQNRFSSPYHYLSFIPIVMYGMFFLKLKKIIPIGLTLCIIFSYVLFQNFNKSTFLEYASNSYYKEFFRKQLIDYNALHKTLDDRQVNELLFVSGDSPPFYVREKSAYKECSALIFSRLEKKPELVNSERFKDYINFFLNYSGEYILLDRSCVDLDHPAFVQLKAKIENDYSEVFHFTNTPREYDAAVVSLHKRNPKLNTTP